jgi:predicted HicB family RNase H-like nuclease
MKKPLVRETLTLRIPTKLHRHLKAVAVDNGRSLNAEIVQRLLRSLEGTAAPEASQHRR